MSTLIGEKINHWMHQIQSALRVTYTELQFEGIKASFFFLMNEPSNGKLYPCEKVHVGNLDISSLFVPLLCVTHIETKKFIQTMLHT